MIFKVLGTIEAHRDNASESALRQGALSNNDKAFERLLAEPRGLFIRTGCIKQTDSGGYTRTTLGKKLQIRIKWLLDMDDYLRGRGQDGFW